MPVCVCQLGLIPMTHLLFHPHNQIPTDNRHYISWTSYVLEIELTHWGRVTHICISKLTIIGSDNGLSPDRRQAIIWTNAGLLLIGPLGTNFSEILIEILTFSIKKMHLKMSSAKRRPFCLCLNVLNRILYMHRKAFITHFQCAFMILWNRWIWKHV